MSTQGSIRRDVSGNWFFVVDVAGADGKRKQLRRRGFDTKRAAQVALSEIQHATRTGAYVEPSKQTLGAFLTEWHEAIRPTVRPSTWASYERNMRVHVLPRIGDVLCRASLRARSPNCTHPFSPTVIAV